MKNIPLFTTESGVASLIFDQIPFNHTAYIRIQSSAEPNQLLKECLDFSKAVGAESVYVTGMEDPDNSISVVSVIQMQRERGGLPKSALPTITVNKTNGELFRSIYNERMCDISHSSAMTQDNLNAIIAQKNGYFVYDDQELLGIGIADGAWIRTIIALKKGAGERILLAMNQKLNDRMVNVELVDTNIRAKRLYERMGFTVKKIISTWYKIL